MPHLLGRLDWSINQVVPLPLVVIVVHKEEVPHASQEMFPAHSHDVSMVISAPATLVFFPPCDGERRSLADCLGRYVSRPWLAPSSRVSLIVLASSAILAGWLRGVLRMVVFCTSDNTIVLL